MSPPEKLVYKNQTEITWSKNDEIIVHGGTKSAQFYMVNLKAAKKLYENFYHLIMHLTCG